MVELGPTEQPEARVKEERIKACVLVPDGGGVRDGGTNHSLGCSGPRGGCSPGMGLQEVGSLHSWGWQGSTGHSWGHPHPMLTMPTPQQGQGTLVLSHRVGLALGELAAAPAPPHAGGSPLPKPKLGHSHGSWAARAGISSVKLQSWA